MASLRKFSLCHPSCFSVYLACWLSKEPVIQASTVEHQRSVLWKPAARIRSSESLAHVEYLFMRANGSWAERLSLIPTPKHFQGFAHPGQGCCLDCVGPLNVISPDGTSPLCSIVPSWDSAKCVLHHKPLCHSNDEKMKKPVNWGSGARSSHPASVV